MSWSKASSDRATRSRRGWLAGAGACGLLPLLGACGFRPLYKGPQGAEVASDLAAIAVTAPRTRLGRILQNQLIDDLNPAGLSVAKAYWLDVRLERLRRALAIQLDERITRYDLTLAAFFTLREGDRPGGREAALVEEVDIEEGRDLMDRLAGDARGAPEPAETAEADPEDAEGGRLLYRSAVRRVATYNVISEPFATLVAEQDAERRAAVEVSREIRTLLTIFFENEIT